MKITVYTITDCQFCVKEKEYLTSKNLTFEEKNVKEKREFLSELLEVSNKFAGVPFTVIEKDDGEKVMLKGFTQSEFDSVLGLGEGKSDSSEVEESPSLKPAGEVDGTEEPEVITPEQTPPAQAPAPAEEVVPQIKPTETAPALTDEPQTLTPASNDNNQAQAQNDLDNIMDNLKNTAVEEPLKDSTPTVETPVEAQPVVPSVEPSAPSMEQPPVGPEPSIETAQPLGSATTGDQPAQQEPKIPDFSAE